MPISVDDIVPGVVLYCKGVAYDREDISINASALTQTESLTGQRDHPAIVLDVEADGKIIIAGLCSFGKSTHLAGVITKSAMKHFMPVEPSVKEPFMQYDPLPNPEPENNRIRNQWLYTRYRYKAWIKVTNGQTAAYPWRYPQETLDKILAVIGPFREVGMPPKYGDHV